MAEETPKHHVGGRLLDVVDSAAPPKPRHSDQEHMDAALERLHTENGKEYEHEDFLPDKKREDRPAFRNVDDAAGELDHRAEERQGEAREAEQERAREAELDADREIREAREWTNDDKGALALVQERARNLQNSTAQFEQELQHAQQNPESVTAEKRAQLFQWAESLKAERAELGQVGTKVQEAAKAKSLAAEQRKLWREFPELAQPETRKELIDYAHSKGIPRARALAETDPAAIGMWFRQMQNEKAQEHKAHLDRPRAPVYRTGPLARGGATPGEGLTETTARARLSKTGSMNDAMNLLTIKRERAKEARNG